MPQRMKAMVNAGGWYTKVLSIDPDKGINSNAQSLVANKLIEYWAQNAALLWCCQVAKLAGIRDLPSLLSTHCTLPLLKG